MSSYVRGVLLIGLASLCWSSAGLFIKIIDLPPVQIALYRSLIAGMFLFSYLVYQRRVRKVPFRFRITRMALITALCYVFTVTLFVTANKLTSSANAVFLQYTAPIYVILISYFFLKESIKASEIATVVICLAGMVLFFLEEEKSTAVVGNLIGILSGISFALLQVSVKRSEMPSQDTSHEVHEMQATFALSLGNVLTVAVLLPIIATVMTFGQDNAGATQLFGSSWQVTAKDLGGLLVLGIFQLGFGYLFFAKGARHISAVEIAIYTLLEPVLNPVWTFLGTGEIPGYWAIIGGVLILTAMVVNTLWEKNSIKEARNGSGLP